MGPAVRVNATGAIERAVVAKISKDIADMPSNNRMSGYYCANGPFLLKPIIDESFRKRILLFTTNDAYRLRPMTIQVSG
jgi:hypothetical protein